MNKYASLKCEVIGYVIEEWRDAFDAWIAEASEAEQEASLRRWANDSELLGVCGLGGDDAVEWWRAYNSEMEA